MLSFHKFPPAFVGALVASVAACALADTVHAGQPAEKPKTAADGNASSAGRKTDAAPPPPTPEDKASARMHDIPVTSNHPAKGLKIPYFDSQGKIQMIFVIGVATRMDADHINMADMQIETFDEAGAHEMAIDLPTSILDLNTSVISTKKHVTISREDFILTGEEMEFNTKTKQGTLGGGVKMIIYNLDNPPPKPATENTAPASTAPAAGAPPTSKPTAP